MKLSILGLSETRWLGAGEMKLDDGETIVYSGLPDEDGVPHERGVAVIMSKEASRSLIEWKPVSERIIVARFHSGVQNTTIIQVYAPTNNAEIEEKEEFYQNLQAEMTKCKSRDVTFVIGDFNAKVGDDNTDREEFMGKHGVGNMNENGEMFCDFCATNDLVIGGTIFPHKTIHKLMWRSPD